MVKKNVNKNIEKEIKQIPLKNYLIVTLIFILSISLMIFFRNWYNSYEEYKKTIPILKDIISEVHYNEFNNYIGDNQSAIIYMGVADDEDCRELEKDLKEIIIDRRLKDKIVYYNITDVNDKELLLKEFNDKYSDEEKIYTYPAIILIEEGNVIAFRSKTANKNLLISDVEQLLDEYEIQGD